MLVQVVKFQSKLSFEKVNELFKKRAPEYEKVPGLIQKYYIKTQDGKYFGGIQVWESEEALKKFHNSELAGSISEKYQVIDQEEIETYEVAFPLHK